MLYLIINTGKKRKSCLVVQDFDKYSRKTLTVSGLIVPVFKGMRVGLEISSSRDILDFSITLDDTPTGKANQTVLRNNGIDIGKYREDLDTCLGFRKTCEKAGCSPNKFSWETLRETKGNFYDILPFSEADKYYKKAGGNAKSGIRMSAIAKEILAVQRGRRAVRYSIEEFLNTFEEVEKKGSFPHLSMTDKLLLLGNKAFSTENGNVVDVEMLKKEKFVNENIAGRVKNGSPLFDKDDIIRFISSQDFELDDEQLYAVTCLTSTKPAVITGGAGSGKTRTIRAIVECFSFFENPEDILLIAPTGKAARRMTEQTGYSAFTIHRALRKAIEDDFLYFNNNRKLPHLLIVVDESSMVDTALMYDLLNAVRADAKIIFVGDSNQLKPVCYGEPFFDFQKGVVPVYKFTKNHRQAEGTDIAKVANDVLNGGYAVCGKGVRVEIIDKMDIPQILYDFDDKDTQFISPRRTICDMANNVLKKSEDVKFSKGDKVIFNKNHKDWCNGDMGIITDITEGGIFVFVNGHNVFVEDKLLKFTTEIDLGYCITVHKMQGSECKRVVIFLEKGNSFDEGVSMLYTAITRARESVHLYYY